MTKHRSTTTEPKRSSLSVLLFLSLLAAGMHSGTALKAQEAKPGIFYSITGKGLKDTSWLFGTFHIINSSYLDTYPAIKDRHNRAGGVVVELTLDSAKMVYFQSAGLLKEKKLSDFLEKSFEDSLDAELKKQTGVGVAQFNRLKPMNVALTLSMIYLMRDNAATIQLYKGMPLDMYFAKTVLQSGKPVTELETVAEQSALLFDTDTPEKQAEGLKTFLRNKNTLQQLGNELLQSWFAHDLQAMDRIYQETLKASGEKDYLIQQRNLNWMKQLPQLMKKQSQFIAVGALHLAGENGLVKLLREAGYTVTPVLLP
ncbi:MAG TPA: TraB/GumN family protein [Chitinophagaceae bacterium]|nr:TraB/GumN family protein [Chitinophagaceae bacterium]